MNKDSLVSRSCPICNTAKGNQLVVLKPKDFIYNNPTHNVAWFEGLSIPENFEFPILKCDNCQFVYTAYRLNDSLNHEFYHLGIELSKSQKKIFSKSKYQHNLDIWRKMLSLYDVQYLDDLRVLDFGAGWGDFLRIVHSSGATIAGLEYDGRKMEYAQSLGLNLGRTEVVQKDAPYDIFMCNQVLEHLNDPFSALLEMNQNVKKGGVGYIAVPTFSDTRWKTVKSQLHSGEAISKEVNPFGHLNYFTPEHLSSLIEKSGFEIIRKKSSRSIFRRRVSKEPLCRFFVRKTNSFNLEI